MQDLTRLFDPVWRLLVANAWRKSHWSKLLSGNEWWQMPVVDLTGFAFLAGIT